MKPGFLLRNSHHQRPQDPQAVRDSHLARTNSTQRREDSLNSKIQTYKKRLDPKFLQVPHNKHQPQNVGQQPLKNASQSIFQGQMNRIEVSMQKTPEKTRIYQDTWDSRTTLPYRPQEPRNIQGKIYTKDENNRVKNQYALHSHGVCIRDYDNYQQNILQIQPLPQDSPFPNQLMRQGSQQVNPKAQEKSVNPNFLALLKLFQLQNELPYHKLKQSMKFFLASQIYNVLGYCSQPIQATKFCLKSPEEINKQLIHKNQQIELIHKISNLYRDFAQKQMQRNPCNRQKLEKIVQKVWSYLFEQYNERFKDYTAYCYTMLNRDGNQPNSTRPDHIQNDTILQRIEELNRRSHSEKRLPQYQDISNASKWKDDPTEKIGYNCFRQQNEFELYKQNGNDPIWLSRDSIHSKKQVTFIIKGKEMSKKDGKIQNCRKLAARQKIISRRPVKFTPQEPQKTAYQKLSLQIDYSYSIQWLAGADGSQIFLLEQKQNLHCLHLSGDPTFEDIQAQLILSVKVNHCQYLRSDCEIKLTKLIRSHKVRHYRAYLIVRQRIINLANNYCWKVSQWKKDCIVEGLEIGNEYGVVKWSQAIDLKKIDFAHESISIEDKSVECQSSQLNKSCQVTFYGLPRELKNKTSRNVQQLFSRHIKKMGEVSLVGIDWQKDQFTVQFTCFWNEPPSKTYPSVPSTALKSPAVHLD